MRLLYIVMFVLLGLGIQVSASDSKSSLIWNSDKNQWQEIEKFWLEYADSRGGLTWGRGETYPKYEDVNEFDTFMVELEEGPCLMEFFHRRWRRANDVRRWNPVINHYAGCPYVFK